MSEALATDLSAIADLTIAVCLAPCLDRGQSSAAEMSEAEELLRVAQEVKWKLDEILEDGTIRAEVVQVITYLENNRERYRQSLLRWVDLLEDIAFYSETKWGDHAGVKKSREVRAALYHVIRGFFGVEGLPTVQPWMRPIVIEIATRATVEFLVTLDNPRDDDQSRALWQQAPPAGTVRTMRAVRIKMSQWNQKFAERAVGFAIRMIMPPPIMSGALKRDVDAILADWAKRNASTQSEPMERVLGVFAHTGSWIGQHGDQVRAAIDLISLTIHESARLSRLDREQRLEVIKNVVILIFQDLGYRGPLFGSIVRFLVDFSADAIQHLFEKRNLLAAAQ
jgi:hypothetical protein